MSFSVYVNPAAVYKAELALLEPETEGKDPVEFRFCRGTVGTLYIVPKAAADAIAFGISWQAGGVVAWAAPMASVKQSATSQRPL
jgi:hypothetical protein